MGLLGGAGAFYFRQGSGGLKLALALVFALAGFTLEQSLGGGYEFIFQQIDLLGMHGDPFKRLGQAGAAVKNGWVTGLIVPFDSGLREATVQAQALAVFLQPVAQGGPFADQGFVGHFGGILVSGDQARRRPGRVKLPPRSGVYRVWKPARRS